MVSFNFTSVATELTKIQEEGITFEDKQQTWDNAEHVKEVVTALENTNIVHFLKLEGNTLGVDAAAAIGKALERHPEFKKALWRNMFTRRLKTEIPQALKLLGNGLMVAKAQLTVLDLSDNALGPNGMVGLEDLLRSPVCYTLNELHLNNCGLGIGGGKMLSKALLDCHRFSTAVGTPLQLKVFVTGRNRLENDGAKAIAQIFTTLKTLEVVAMPQNSIYYDGIKALAESFKQNPNLRVLNLNDNTMTHKGAAYMAEAFACTQNLQEINFGDCLLKTNGAYHLAEALEDGHPALEVIDLSFNEIGIDGGLVLVKVLQNKPNLKTLNLDGNQFGAEGRERIKESMKASINPNSLGSLDEDDEEYNDEDADDDGDGDEEEDVEEEETYEHEVHDVSTDEPEEDEYQDDYDEDDESAYVTTQAFSTKLFGDNESFSSNKTVGFLADKTATITGNNGAEKSTAEAFCLSQQPCTLQMFESLQVSDKLAAFKDILDQFTDDNYLLVLIFTTLKCAHLAQLSDSALEVAMALFKEAIDYAVRTKQERRVLNYFLIQLGLLRSEEKFKSEYDLKSCRFALRQTLEKQQIASEHMKNAFNVFLQKLDT